MQNKKTVNIGILCKELNKLRNFELRIIQEIQNDSDLELKLLIFDGRKNNKLGNLLKNALKSGKIISKIILKVQEFIELSLFKITDLVEKEPILNKLKEIDHIYLYPERKSYYDIFNDEDCKKIKKYELDLLLRFEFNIIKGEILNEPKYGIWSFHHADNHENRGGPACFWEVLNKNKHVGVTLQRLTPELDGGDIIDKAYYNLKWSWIKTRNIVFESSVNLIIKNLNRLKNDKLRIEKSTLYYYQLFKSPDLINIMKYQFFFYTRLIIRLYRRFTIYAFSSRYKHWAIIISKGNFLNSVLHRLDPIISPANEYWADPFILSYKGDEYVFFENYEYDKKKGKISCGKIKENRLIEVKDVLEKPYHMSYPNVFYHNQELFMIPETHKNKRLEIYKCSSFPNKWDLYSTGFEGERVADCNFYVDENNSKWLFLNKHEPQSVLHSDLYIYKIDSLQLNTITPHNDNPVIINTDIARNAGPIFKYNSKLYRPSQINIEGIYGRGLNINEIVTLNIDEYKELATEKCIPHFKKNVIGMHHLHQTNNYFVFDICFNRRRKNCIKFHEKSK